MHLLSVYILLSSSVCNVICDAGTLSLWSLESHWHTMPNSRHSNSCCLLVLAVTDLVCLLARHLITPVRILGWWELKVMQLSVCIFFQNDKPRCNFERKCILIIDHFQQSKSVSNSYSNLDKSVANWASR